MGTFEILEHTADVEVVGIGKDFPEALSQAAHGMFSIIIDVSRVENRESIEVAVDSIDRDALVVDWLNELLYRFAAEGFVPGEFDVAVGGDERSLVATCFGEMFDPQRHATGTDVKAATYHGLQVAGNGDWRIQVLLDV